MRNLVPRFITDRRHEGQLDGAFPAAGLFLDLSGFTHMTEALMAHGQGGAEALAVIMRRVFDPLIGCVEDYGGFVVGFEGDAFHALHPAQAGDLREAARRAVAAAWEMQQWMAAHSEQETPHGRFAISAKIGVALGDAEWGILTSSTGRRAAYYFRGPVIEGAAAAQGQAMRGEIILDQMICELLRPDVAPVAPPADSRAAHAYYRLESAPDLIAPGSLTGTGGADPVISELFAPPEVRNQAASGEFRHAVSVFVRLAAEPTAAELKAFVDRVFALQDRYGGMLSRLAFGDKGTHLLLFWGAPTSHENDIERALSFVLDLRSLRSQSSESELPFSAGVTYRIAHAGFIGGERREDYTCYGRGVNLAARLMTGAPPGAIWVDAPIAERARVAFKLIHLGQRAFKGFEEEQAVYELAGRAGSFDKHYEGILVGRQADLARLIAFVEPLSAARSPGMLVVWGEAGIGKSRLVDAFMKAPDGPTARGWLVAMCQADQILRQSLNPFRYWLRRYFDQRSSPSENRRKFQQRLDGLIGEISALADPGAELAAELQRTRSFLEALVDLHQPGSLYDQLDAQGRFENTLQALAALLQAESLRQPVIIHLEDAHWLDEESRDFVIGLARMLSTDDGRRYPIAVIATARPEPGQALFEDDAPLATMRLERLSSDDLTALASEVLGSAAAPDLLGFLNGRAEGNPFFAEQLLRYLIDHGAVTPGPDGWHLLQQTLEAAPVPDDVQALLVARLDRLASDVRSVVQTAAVLGREFEVRVLSAMLRGDAELPRKVDDAEQAAIWSALDTLRYLFLHALLRDAAYDMQIRSRLAALHALAASGLQAVYEQDLAPHYADLAYHYGRAGEFSAERRYSRLAGERAASQYANAEAARLLARALELTPDDEPRERYELLSALERVHDLRGDRAAQRDALGALSTAADALDDRQLVAEAALRAANLARVTGDLAGARAHVERADAFADGVVAARAGELRARILLHSGDYAEALRWLVEAHGLAIRAGDQSVAAQTLYDTGIGYYYQDRFGEALQYFRQAQPLYQALGDRRGEINTLLMFGTVYSRQGEHEAAREKLDEALSHCHAIGWRHGETYVLGNLANSYFDQGDYETTRELHTHALALAREIGDREGEAASLSTLALVAHRLGDPAAAMDLYRQASEIQSALGYLLGEGYTLTGMGHALVDLGDLDAAEHAFSDALEIRRRLDPETPLAVDDLAGLALVALRRGDEDRAATHALEAVTWMRAHGVAGVEFPIQAWLICYRAFTAKARQEREYASRAAEALSSGHALLEEQAAAIKDEQLRRAYLWNVPFHRDLAEEWRRHSDP